MDFIKAQRTKIPQVNPVDLSNSTVFITGANGGIGLEAAREVLRSKPKRLIVAVRDIEKGQAAVKSLTEGSSSSTEIEVRKLDQASFSSVRNCVKELNGEPVHVAILNAGVWSTRFDLTSDKLETDLQVNALAPALLSLLLLPNLRKSASTSSTIKPHMTFVTSGLHEMAKFPESKSSPGSILAKLNDSSKYNQQDRYPTTKTVNIIWMRELARRVLASEVVINGPNPGFCNTGLLRQNSGFMGQIIKISTALFARSAADGARCVVDAAIVKGEATHGKYLSEMEIKQESKLVRDASANGLSKGLWNEIMAKFDELGFGPFEISDEKM